MWHSDNGTLYKIKINQFYVYQDGQISKCCMKNASCSIIKHLCIKDKAILYIIYRYICILKKLKTWAENLPHASTRLCLRREVNRTECKNKIEVGTEGALSFICQIQFLEKEIWRKNVKFVKSVVNTQMLAIMYSVIFWIFHTSED